MTEVDVQSYEPDALKTEVTPQRWNSLFDTARSSPPAATLWHINSTAAGGGVAEMLHP
ncbi:hypothetical protein [Rhodococcus sp. 14-2470-1a]|uniref:hypothetical protein n=1 Tax=Rhodococcus sp. 14-2470-1a TaxID=2023150 RepID=UPI0015C6178A|nr:hypothetical protein [Rhodococcus sp. 14-2470-1a]